MKKTASILLIACILLATVSCGLFQEEFAPIVQGEPDNSTRPDTDDTQNNILNIIPGSGDNTQNDSDFESNDPSTTPPTNDTPSTDHNVHNHSYTSIISAKPTCTEKGITTFTCTCGDHYTVEIDSTGHDWTAATCKEAKTCKTCQEQIGTPTEHVWVDATCTEYKHCSVCEEIASTTLLPHTGGTATCTTKARCTRCNQYYGEKADHTYVEATCTKAKHCSECNQTVGSPISHSYKNGVCTMCSKADPSIPTFTITGGLPIKKNGCKVTSATTRVSGSTLYLTISGIRESGSSDVSFLVHVFSSGYTAQTASARETLEGISAGSNFSYTFVLEDAVRPEYTNYNVWID